MRIAVLVWGVAALVWMALEGNVTADVLLAVTGLGLVAAHVVARYGIGRRLTAGRRVGLGALVGLGIGAALAPATLLLMAVKTGLHAHGPAYTAAEMAWLWGQWPWWAGAGALAGVGLALLLSARGR